MKKCYLFLVAGILLLGSCGPAGASWLLDTERFHASVHGQTACMECHEDVQEAALHPNPKDVNRTLSDFFDPQTCFACHDEVSSDLEEGRHGGEKEVDREQYRACLNCHDPHYDASGAAKRKDSKQNKKTEERPACGSCHGQQSAIPPFSAEDQQCLTCHEKMNVGTEAGKERLATFCFHCHGESGKALRTSAGAMIPLMQEDSYRDSPHGSEACTVCHRESLRFPHNRQEIFSCSNCHLPHHEKVAHDAHSRVSCEACHHLAGTKPVRNPATGRVTGKIDRTLSDPSTFHEMTLPNKEESCRACHFPGNRIGASAMVLPAKSILCMPCHTATFSVGDATTMAALAIFLAGILLFILWILSGTIPEAPNLTIFGKTAFLLSRTAQTIFSKKIVPITKALFTDVFCQRRLFRRSRLRWVIHGLIFFPFVFRFLWGMIALLTSLWLPECSLPWAMINKDAPVTGFLFDVTGFMILAGVTLAFLRGLRARKDRASGLPGQDHLALGLIGGIVVVGFILEGMRIAMAGFPCGSAYAFLGYGIGRLFSAPDHLVEVYGFVWYIHAVLTGAFIAYIPFSKLFHIIIGPLALAINAATSHDEGNKKGTHHG